MAKAVRLVVIYLCSLGAGLSAAVGVAAFELRQAAKQPRPLGGSDVRVEVQGVLGGSDANIAAVVLMPAGSDSSRALVVLVPPEEGEQISARLEGAEPLDGGALGPAIRELGGKLERVRIEDVLPMDAHAILFLTEDRRAFELSAPASQSIEVALESHAPIFVSRELLDSFGMSPQELEGLLKSEDPAESPQSHLDPGVKL